MIKRVFKVLMVPIAITLILWTGGFEFNQRNPWIAYGLIVCLFLMYLTWDLLEDD